MQVTESKQDSQKFKPVFNTSEGEECLWTSLYQAYPAFINSARL